MAATLPGENSRMPHAALTWPSRFPGLFPRRGWRRFLPLQRWLKPHATRRELHIVTMYSSVNLIERSQSSDIQPLLLDAGFKIHRLMRRGDATHSLSNFTALHE